MDYPPQFLEMVDAAVVIRLAGLPDSELVDRGLESVEAFEKATRQTCPENARTQVDALRHCFSVAIGLRLEQVSTRPEGGTRST